MQALTNMSRPSSRAVAPSQSMGSGITSFRRKQLPRPREPDALASFRDQLSRLGAYVFTINAFPFGPFHGVRVKRASLSPRTGATGSV